MRHVHQDLQKAAAHSGQHSLPAHGHLSNTVHRQVALLGKIALGCVLAAGLALPWGLAGRIVALLLGEVAAGLGFLALIGAIVARKTDRQLAELEQGRYLAHWTYSNEESRRYAAAELTRAPPDRWGPVVGFSICGGIVGGCFAGAGCTLLGSRAVFALACVCAGGLLGFALGQLSVAVVHARYRRRLGGLGEAYVGPDGLYFERNYEPWQRINQSLTSVRFREGPPPVLELTFRLYECHYILYKTIRVPVPAGREEEARRVLDQIRWLRGLGSSGPGAADADQQPKPAQGLPPSARVNLQVTAP